MKHSAGNQSSLIGTLFTLLLFLLFVLCALFTVLLGGKVYENMSVRMEQQFTGSVALQYVANKVRQSDVAGQVSVREIEGVPVLELAQEIDGYNYLTWIYCRDGAICELFAGEDSGLGLADGIAIIECSGWKLLQEGRLLTVETTDEGGGRLLLSLRSDGGQHE